MPVGLTPPAALNALAVLDFVAGGFALLAALASVFLLGPRELLPAILVALFCGTIDPLCLGAGLGGPEASPAGTESKPGHSARHSHARFVRQCVVGERLSKDREQAFG